MITGDNPLTAVHVAKEVEIVDRDVLILDAPEHSVHGEESLVWRSVDDKVRIDVDPTKPIDPEIIKNKDICVTGYALSKFKDQVGWKTLLRWTWVYARVSPKQKEDILLGLKDMGYYTLMAGDGTNDVGALKQAHIGVALLNGTQDDLTRIAEHARNTKMKELYQKQVDMLARWNQPAPPVPVLIAHLFPPGPSNPHYQKAMEREAQKKGVTVEALAKSSNHAAAIETVTSPGAQKLLNADPKQAKAAEASKKAAGFADKLTQSMMDAELDDGEPPSLKLGDASVAAPFTSKLRNVVAIPNIIRQGRCTLVATIQMYKILALNCLISAYSLSVLYLEGIKFGDGQITISGMLMSVCFLSISRARSVEGLSKERPQPNIFNFYIIGSILGQFAVHVATLIYVARYCDVLEPYVLPPHPSPLADPTNPSQALRIPRPRSRVRPLAPQLGRLPPPAHPANLDLRRQLPGPPLPRVPLGKQGHVLRHPGRHGRRLFLLDRVHPRAQPGHEVGPVQGRVQDDAYRGHGAGLRRVLRD